MGWSKGPCRFDGSSMSKAINYGGMQIYYNGSVKKTGTSGSKNIWSGDGDICVVYSQKNQIGNQIFKVSGKVQECTKLAR